MSEKLEISLSIQKTQRFIQGFLDIHEKDSSNGLNVSVEKTNYEPIELEELKRIQEKD